uniref:Ig-like domain-containing protein n=1 Tax=Erpetoichthys calabaricus TaxID=27687 RepID=A0A8C4SWY3_ERPCA
NKLFVSLISANNCLNAITGETVQFNCSLNVKESLEAEDISVEWTTGEGHIVHAFVKGKDDLSDSQFKGRSQLFTSELSCGNFSLILSNVSVTDKGEFNCHYHHSSIGDNSSKLLSKHCLLVVVAGLNNSEVKFICTSDGGYPEPKVHWAVNKVPVVDSSRVNTALSKDSRGRYSVTSVLTANVTVNESVTCTIENEKLGDNKTWAEPESKFPLYLSTSRTKLERSNSQSRTVPEIIKKSHIKVGVKRRLLIRVQTKNIGTQWEKSTKCQL